MPKTSFDGPNIRVDVINSDPGLTSEQVKTYLKDAAGGYSCDQLAAAFDTVKNAEHWKNPIDTTAPANQRDILERAIPWFTGTDASFTPTDDPVIIRVTAPGYFAGPCN